MRITATALQDLVAAIFQAAGCSGDESYRIGLYLARSNLTGHDSHGVIRVPRYLGWLTDGTLVPNRQPERIMESDAFALLDAGYGFGQTAGPEAVRLGMEKAHAAGVSVVALRHSGHLGRIGEWAEQAAEAGIASVHFVNVAGSMLVAPFGGTERRLSTAPFAAGFPVPGTTPVILDFATSAVAEGKVLVASKVGKSLPEGCLIEADGRLSTDPAALYGSFTEDGPRDARNGTGALRAFGEHKGSGLALMCELLAGALTGSGTSGPGPRRFCNGMLSIYMAPSFFSSGHDAAAEARAYLDFVKSSRPASINGEILLPGEPERRMRAERLEHGVPLGDEVWASLCSAARQYAIDAEAYRTRS